MITSGGFCRLTGAKEVEVDNTEAIGGGDVDLRTGDDDADDAEARDPEGCWAPGDEDEEKFGGRDDLSEEESEMLGTVSLLSRRPRAKDGKREVSDL